MVNAVITPKGQLELLSKREIELLQSSSDCLYSELYRNCTLAVLSTGADTDDGHQLLAAHKDFSVELISSPRGVRLKLSNAPDNAFVGGQIIEGIRAHLFAVLRDIVFLQDQFQQWEERGESVTDIVFKTLRHARALQARKRPNLVVCWGGHSINDYEYNYTKEVGYRLGLRGLDICTGCGIGAMKGPMKGATIAHAKQRMHAPRYIGISEPGIIASEAPNAIVNELIIMPDIEKRLEAFVRLGHGIIVFPGGVGTAEEILYILGILLHEKNKGCKLPLIFTGPEKSKEYFKQLDDFIALTLGQEARDLYTIIIDDAIEVAQAMHKAMKQITKNRQKLDDAYYYNWSLVIDENFQQSFAPTHDNMAQLNLSKDQPVAEFASDLRRAFSGIVAGNIKPLGINAIKQHGPYKLNGDTDVMQALDKLLASFVQQKRMKISGDYVPCYELSTD
ncbi:nucleotide 5'-monophosphate nucleosidase PpnN [Arenicella sp.]|nr:nucleotide 5'-monophosphate nucleosidase PpnN [Arenicella sp.]